MAYTVRAVAKLAGVSPMTVSRVVNGSTQVKEETRGRVQRAIDELDYVPNRLARGLTSSKSGTIGLIVPDVVNPFFTMVLRGAEAAARRAGYRLLVCDSANDSRREREYIEDLVSYRVDGLLVAPASERSKVGLLPLLRRGFPFVLIDRSIIDLKCDSVQSDNVTGARLLTLSLCTESHFRSMIDRSMSTNGKPRCRA